jgi:hypothetical protein
MKKMIIFDPAMCCSTGVCGPSVDPQLLRVSTVLNRLKNKGIVVQRYNLTNNPQAFVDNTITVLDGKIVKTKAYPTNEEFSKMLDIPEEYLKTKIQIKTKGCGCGDGCC